MPVVLPFVPSNARYSFTTTLTNDDPFLHAAGATQDTYRFDVRWNTRSAAWYFDLYDASGSLIAAGLKVVLGCQIGRTWVKDPRFPTGAIVARDTTRAGIDAGFDDITTRVQVIYLSWQETVGGWGPSAD